MKTEEDEAFDELARKQGSWGGGFPAKRAMAMDKLQEPVECLDCGSHNVGVPATYDSLVDSVKAQPAQEPVAQGSKEHLKIMMEHSAWDDRLELSDALANIDEFYATAPPKPAQEPVNLLEARRIAAEYGTPDSQVDNGNLYFALSKCLEHIDALPAQEPRNVRERWNVELDGNDLLVCFNDHEKGDKCQYERYSPQREWVGLTAEDFSAIKFPTEMRFPAEFRAGARWAEVKLKDKNT